jgi:hypothetical protein
MRLYRHRNLTKNIKYFRQVVHGCVSFDQGPHSLVYTPDSFRDTVDVLGLDNGFEIIFEDLCEVVCAYMSRLEREYTGEETYSATQILGST